MKIHGLAKTCPQSRLLLVERILLQQLTVAEAAEAAGISRRTMYKWLARYRNKACPGCSIGRLGHIAVRVARPRSARIW